GICSPAAAARREGRRRLTDGDAAPPEPRAAGRGNGRRRAFVDGPSRARRARAARRGDARHGRVLPGACRDHQAAARFGADDEAFCLEQNARVARSAEEYYRTMFLRDDSTWNLRERHRDACRLVGFTTYTG